jgi:hypothetical protein
MPPLAAATSDIRPAFSTILALALLIQPPGGGARTALGTLRTTGGLFEAENEAYLG